MTSLKQAALGRRGSAYRWLSANYADVTDTFPGKVSWEAVADAALRDGVTRSPDAFRRAWPKVVRDKQRSIQAKSPTLPAPSQTLSWGRPTEPGANVTNRPVLKPATIRNPNKDK
jgi:hypothetical protein